MPSGSAARRKAASLQALIVVLCPSLCAQFSGSYPLLDGDVIRYQGTPPDDSVARLQRRLDRGTAKLSYRLPNGYLLSVLEHLNVPLSSQMLVFSKTSSQQPRISPATPRALYFSDSVYVGWVHGGDFLELAAVDPFQGTMFYTLEQREMQQPKFVHRQECLQCHATPNTLGVPGLLMRSVFTAPDGVPDPHADSFVTTQSSPLQQRWGGWYVTGTHGHQRHMGNAFIQDKDYPARLDREGGANLTSLKEKFDVSVYPVPHSDLVALMILAHQTRMHDLITRVNWETRLALHEHAPMNQATNQPAGVRPDALPRVDRQRIDRAVEILLRSMLFSDEARLEAPIRGTSTFAMEFAATGPRDSAGRSLKDLALDHRLFRYPCSFLIYSDAFNALPKPALDTFYRRLWDVLTGEDRDVAFATLTSFDRKAILSILRHTKADLPGYWRSGDDSDPHAK
jgi:hypothetical protein